MAAINLGARQSKRGLNHELPLVPFIDFLLCLVAFLLVTAIWSELARVEADAKVPGAADGPEPAKAAELHVEVRGERQFQLVWREGSTVISTTDVPRQVVRVGTGEDISYPELANKVDAEWKLHGSHRNAGDLNFDRAVLHTDNTTEFMHLIAVIDAIHRPERDVSDLSGKLQRVPAFRVAFASN